MHETGYVGYVVNERGILPNPKKIEAVKNFPRPDDLKALRGFLGLCSYYRRFVRDFSRVAYPLSHLLKKETNWKWTPDCEESFVALKERLTSAPILHHYEEGLNNEVHTDASLVGLGAVLIQKKDGEERVVCYVSRRTYDTKTRYTSMELECQAVIWSLGEFRTYIHGKPVTVVTDNAAVTYLRSKNAINRKFQRWVIELEEYQPVTFVHRAGKSNVVPDALSRAPVNGGEEDVTIPDEKLFACALIPSSPIPAVELAALQAGCVDFSSIINVLQNIPVNGISARTIATIQKDFVLRGGILFKSNSRNGRRFLLAVPPSLRRDIIHQCHSSIVGGHVGCEKTLLKISQRYFWPRMTRHIKGFVKTCLHCQFRKPPPGKTPGLLQPIRPPDRPFQMMGIDHIGPITSSKKGQVKHIIVTVDYLTKWVEAKAVYTTSSEEAVDFVMKNIILKHGTPSHLISDRGSSYSSEEFASLLSTLSVTHGITSGYHPQANGLVERNNRTVAEIISAYVNKNQDNWDEWLDYAVFAINTCNKSLPL